MRSWLDTYTAYIEAFGEPQGIPDTRFWTGEQVAALLEQMAAAIAAGEPLPPIEGEYDWLPEGAVV